MARQRGAHRRSKRSPSGRLRIVAGKWRSRLLPVADVAGLRPTSERIRETLFNWLGGAVTGARCLDLFAGTGALGFEALSRGAAEVDFVERARAGVEALRKSKAALEASAARIHEQDAFEFLRGAGSGYDIVFLDPPYADDSLAKLCRLLADGGWIAEGGYVYFECSKQQAATAFPDTWELTHEKTAGRVCYGLLRAWRSG